MFGVTKKSQNSNIAARIVNNTINAFLKFDLNSIADIGNNTNNDICIEVNSSILTAS